jgi:hypothetical protein
MSRLGIIKILLLSELGCVFCASCAYFWLKKEREMSQQAQKKSHAVSKIEPSVISLLCIVV